MFLVILILTGYGVLCYFNLNIFFNFMPIFRCDDCRMIQVEDKNQSIYLWELNLNQLVFILVNWFELAYMYFLYRKLKAKRQTQLNIFVEVIVAAYAWIFCSIFYFTMNIIQFSK